ncbi:MAG: cyclic nucleotide-binding domain-containing protein [Gammaproteobacteria bacterium]
MMSALESNHEALVSTLIPICNLSAHGQAQIVKASALLPFARGSYVFKEGQRDNYSYYLLEGHLELLNAGQTVQRISGGSTEATRALAQLQPRKMSARAESDVTVLQVPRDLVETLTAAEQVDVEDGASFQVDEIDSAEVDDWMTRMLRSQLFARLPASNIHRVFTLLETVEVKQGDFVVRQGEAGDYYYVIVNGRAEVVRAAGPSAPSYRLAVIGPGEAFGEEALVGEAERNASVRMLTDGQLVRLLKADFVDLIRKPLLSALTLDEGRNLAEGRGAVWLDVRFPEEHGRGALENSINHPLNTLRMHSGRLDPSPTYIVYCDDGTRSAVAAFLLAERGFDVHYLDGGLNAYRGTESDAGLDLSLHDDDSASFDTPRTAPLPKSHLTAAERGEDPAVTAAVLQVDLAQAEIQVEAAERNVAEANRREPEAEEPTARRGAIARSQRDEALRAATDKARSEVARAAQRRIAAERARAQTELEQARRDAEQAAEQRVQEERRRFEAEAEQARAEIAQARRAAEQAAEQRLLEERSRFEAEAEQAREAFDQVRRTAEHEAELRVQEERRRLETETENARRELEAARRMKEEIEQARAAAETAVQREREAQEHKVAQVRAEMERKLKEEQAKIKESYAWQGEELKRLQAQKQAAEARLRQEQSAARRQAEESRARLAEARAFQQRLEEVQQASATEAAAREQQQIELERRLREELQHKVQSERQQLEQELARNAEELARARHELVAAEAARKAAAQEAEEIVADIKTAHARKRLEEEAEMQLERARLEAEAKRLRLSLELTQREREAAVAEQRRIAAEIELLRSAGTSAGDDIARDLQSLEQQASAAARHLADTERARADAQAAAVASAGDLAAHDVHEGQVRSALEEELEEWLKEQSDLEGSDAQRDVLANQKAHLERIKKRASEARAAAKAHDQALLDELANRLRDPDEDD